MFQGLRTRHCVVLSTWFLLGKDRSSQSDQIILLRVYKNQQKFNKKIKKPVELVPT